MKIHSDKLKRADIYPALSEAGLTDVYAQAIDCGSRKRAHGIEFRLEALRGSGRKRNSGTHGAEATYAATWDEHGALFAVLFDQDPGAIIGPYDGRDDFHAQTKEQYRRIAA